MASRMQILGKKISNGKEKNELVKKTDGAKRKWYLEKFVFL
jgi:hypothetical protein